MYQNTPKTSIFCTEKWMNFLNGLFLFQLILLSRKFWNIMVGNLTSGLLINIDFSKRLLNEACGVLLYCLFVAFRIIYIFKSVVNMFLSVVYLVHMATDQTELNTTSLKTERFSKTNTITKRSNTLTFQTFLNS